MEAIGLALGRLGPVAAGRSALSEPGRRRSPIDRSCPCRWLGGLAADGMSCPPCWREHLTIRPPVVLPQARKIAGMNRRTGAVRRGRLGGETPRRGGPRAGGTAAGQGQACGGDRRDGQAACWLAADLAAAGCAGCGRSGGLRKLGLLDDPRWVGGRPRRISPDDERFIVAAATTRPERLGCALRTGACASSPTTGPATPSGGQAGAAAADPAPPQALVQRTRTRKESTDPLREAKLDRIEAVTSTWPDRCFAFDQFGSLSVRPYQATRPGLRIGGRPPHPRRLPAKRPDLVLQWPFPYDRAISLFCEALSCFFQSWTHHHGSLGVLPGRLTEWAGRTIFVTRD
jgi:hypothetical protein